MVGRRVVGEAFQDRLGNCCQVLQTAMGLLAMPEGDVIEHHMKLADQNQNTNAGQHPLDHGRGNRAKPLSESQSAGDDLQQAGDENGGAQHHQRIGDRFAFGDRLSFPDACQKMLSPIGQQIGHNHKQAGRWSAHLQRRTRKNSDHDAADDSR